MRKGFTLLELLVVIIIIGVLAVIALTQYRNLTERARSAEARSIIAGVRTAQAVVHEETGSYTDDWDLMGSVIATPQTDSGCTEATNWFWYSLTAGAGGCPAGSTATPDCYEVTATRCTTAGKNPPFSQTYYLLLKEDHDGVQERLTDVNRPGDTAVPW